MIPTVDAAAILDALTEFDRDFRNAATWRGWQENKALKRNRCLRGVVDQPHRLCKSERSGLSA